MRAKQAAASRRAAERGYTLIEIMIVVLIIGLISTMVAVNVFRHMVTAKQEIARADMKTISDALEIYRLEFGHLPTSSEGLGVLLSQGLIKKAPLDPWKHPFVYELARGGYSLRSLGADGQPGGEGEDQDLSPDDGQEPEQAQEPRTGPP
jgi:general secretion pathway protein G